MPSYCPKCGTTLKRGACDNQLCASFKKKLTAEQKYGSGNATPQSLPTPLIVLTILLAQLSVLSIFFATTNYELVTQKLGSTFASASLTTSALMLFTAITLHAGLRMSRWIYVCLTLAQLLRSYFSAQDYALTAWLFVGLLFFFTPNSRRYFGSSTRSAIKTALPTKWQLVAAVIYVIAALLVINSIVLSCYTGVAFEIRIGHIILWAALGSLLVGLGLWISGTIDKTRHLGIFLICCSVNAVVAATSVASNADHSTLSNLQFWFSDYTIGAAYTSIMFCLGIGLLRLTPPKTKEAPTRTPSSTLVVDRLSDI